jgi:hypothetical protein
MSRGADIRIVFPDEERTYRLGIGQLRVLQEKTNRGPQEILNRILTGGWFVDEVIEVIRQGLLGGGAKPAEVDALLRTYVIEGDWMANIECARAVLMAALMRQVDGDEIEDPPPKAGPGETRTATEGSASPSSTPREPSSAGAPTS